MEKIKQFLGSEKGKTILTIIVVVLVGVASFELGRLSKTNSGGLEIEYGANLSGLQNETTSASAILSLEKGEIPVNKTTVVPKPQSKPKPQISGFMASSRGSKYYPLDCDAGKNLKPENRIYFDTREQAEAAGYELSSSCR